MHRTGKFLYLVTVLVSAMLGSCSDSTFSGARLASPSTRATAMQANSNISSANAASSSGKTLSTDANAQAASANQPTIDNIAQYSGTPVTPSPTPTASPTTPTTPSNIGSNCLSTTQNQNFSCNDIQQVKGGLSDALVGVKLMLLTQKMPVLIGEAVCGSMGGELIAYGDFFANPIANCISDEDYWQVQTSAGIYAKISMAAILLKFGQSVVNNCLNAPDTNPSMATIPLGTPQNPLIPMNIYCVFAL